MKRLLAALLAVVLVCSMSIPAFAAEEEKENNVTVKYVTTVEGAYVAKVQNGAASISADGVSVSVTGAPSNAKTLVVIPMTGDALSWIDSCVDGDAKAAYDIHFEDAEGNRIGANGVSAVSYTHLDVYKRQDYRCCCMRNRLGIVLPGQRRSAGTRSRLRTATERRKRRDHPR